MFKSCFDRFGPFSRKGPRGFELLRTLTFSLLISLLCTIFFPILMQNSQSSSSSSSFQKNRIRQQKQKQKEKPDGSNRQARPARMRRNKETAFNIARSAAPGESLLRAKLSSQYARQLVLPGSVSAPILLPAETTRQMCSRVITKTFDVSAANLTASQSVVVVMGPNMLMPASVSRAGGTAIPAVGRDSLTASGKFQQTSSSADTSGLFHVKTTNGSKGTAPLVNITDNLGVTYPGILWNSAGGTVTGNVTLHADVDSADTVNFNVRSTSNGGGVAPWTSVVHIGPVYERESVRFSFLVPVGTLGLSFFWTTDSAGLHETDDEVLYNLDLHDESAAVTLGPDLTLFPEIAPKILDSKITDGRVVSMSMLLTNTTSDIYKQGDISIGRVPVEMLRRPVSEWVTAMSALPENRRHLGPASTGGYSFWIPDSISTSEPITREQFGSAYRESEYLVAVIRNLDPAHVSFRATFTWNVEFFSESQLFEKRLTPSVTAEYKELFRAISMLPAASCNPEHESLFRSLFQKAIGGAGAVYQHYQGNKAMYDAIAKALAAALL